MSLHEEQLLEQRYLLPTYGRKPLQFVRGEGMRLYDDTGREYLDFLAGIGAVSVGHANPRVTKAIQQQAARLLHVGNYFYVEGRGELASRVSRLLNASEAQEATATAVSEQPWQTFFANSGTEAVEGAIKLARRYGARHLKGASTIISAQRSFHGRTLAALAATGQPAKQEAFRPLPPGFLHLPLNDLDALRAALHIETPCAVLLEVIQGEGGVWPCDEHYLRAVRELTAERGILLILDEIQTGFFRTGPAFAFQHTGILPDIVTLAKGIANGVPLGAVAARGLAATGFEPGDHGSTFGGSPLAIAAAHATLDECAARDIGANVKKVGDFLASELARLPLVVEVRGRGLMRAVQLAEPRAAQVLDAALAEGLVCNAIGESILRFLPPLVCTTNEVDTLISRLSAILLKKGTS
jgi:acetylornithine aminotransferase